MKITKEMVEDFNKTLENLDCVFKLELEEDYNPKCKIVLANKMFVASAIINLSDEFYNIMEKFFLKRNIELSYNNIGDIFWSKTGWNDIK